MKTMLTIMACISFSLMVCAQITPNSYQASIDKYTNQINREPENLLIPIWYQQRGLTYYRMGNCAKAIADFSEAIAGKNDNRNWAEAVYYRSLCFKRLGNIAAALDGYNALLDELSAEEKINGQITRNDLIWHRIEIYKQLGNWVAVSQNLAKISPTTPKSKSFLDSLVDKNSLVASYQLKIVEALINSSDSRRIATSYSYFTKGELTQAFEQIGGELESDVPKRRILALFLNGYYHASKNSFQEAQNNFTLVLTQSLDFNTNGVVHFYFSFVKEKLGDLDGAKDQIKRSGKIFTSEKSLMPASVVTKRMAQLGVKPSEPIKKTVEVAPEQILVKSTKKVEEPIQKVTNKTDNPKKQDAFISSEKPVVAQKTLSSSEQEIYKLTQALTTDPENLQHYLNRGIAFFRANQFSQALVDFNNYIKLSAGQYKGQADLYRIKSLEKVNQPEKAIIAFSDMLKKYSDAELLSLQTNRKDLLVNRARLLAKTQNFTACLNDYRKALSLNPQDELLKSKIDSMYATDPIYKILSYDFFELRRDEITKRLADAEKAYQEGNFILARAIASEEIAKGGSSNTALMVRGFTRVAAKDFKSAADDLNLVAQSSSSINQKGLASFYLSYVQQKLNNSDEAINQISEALKIFTTEKSLVPWSILILQRAELFEKQGFSDMAVKDYDQYLSTKPGDSKIRQKRSALADSKQPEIATNTRAPIVTKSLPEEVAPKKIEPSLKDLYLKEKRYALVIGNSNYPPEIGKLINPSNDAEDLKNELEKSDFEVVLLKNVTFRQIEVAANNFYKKLNEGPKDNTVGLFYYSGHGLQYEGQNYIIPIDAQVTVPEDVRYTCYPADKLMAKMEFAATRLNIVIMDACRSNPFPVAARSSSPGLAQPRAAKGSYVAFATAPGSTASDGNGRNGLYTQELLKAMRKPELAIEQVFKEVRVNVQKGSEGKQNTWDNSNIIGDFYFKFKD